MENVDTAIIKVWLSRNLWELYGNIEGASCCAKLCQKHSMKNSKKKLCFTYLNFPLFSKVIVNGVGDELVPSILSSILMLDKFGVFQAPGLVIITRTQCPLRQTGIKTSGFVQMCLCRAQFFTLRCCFWASVRLSSASNAFSSPMLDGTWWILLKNILL